MQPIPFPEQNTVIAEHQKEYLPLPAYVTDKPQGEVICRISVSPEELKEIVETGGFYLSVWCFRDSEGKINAFPPIRCFTENPFVNLYNINDISPAGLYDVLQSGTRIGNFGIGKDIILFEVVSINGESISYKLFRPDGGAVIATHLKTFTEFSTLLNEVTKHIEDWFCINPK